MMNSRSVARRLFSVSSPPKVLITGCGGQIGTELVQLLRSKYGVNNIVASDIKKPSEKLSAGPFEYLDVLDKGSIESAVVKHNIDWMVHFSSVISGVAEQNPSLALNVNVDGVRNVFEVCKNHKLRVLAPSTIAVYSPESGLDMTKDDTILQPTTIYGITKVFLEQLGGYYNKKYGMDFRSLRFPGIISSGALPGGGTTDYAVMIFYEAVKHGTFTCFLDKDEKLPMMYMPDCLSATMSLLEADQSLLKRSTYNVTAVSFTPEEIATCIKKHIPHLEVKYVPDFRQKIAATWPNSLDDSNARSDWGWKHQFDLDQMVADMLPKVEEKVKSGAY